jgi:hypothetical protein
MLRWLPSLPIVQLQGIFIERPHQNTLLGEPITTYCLVLGGFSVPET